MKALYLRIETRVGIYDRARGLAHIRGETLLVLALDPVKLGKYGLVVPESEQVL